MPRVVITGATGFIGSHVVRCSSAATMLEQLSGIEGPAVRLPVRAALALAEAPVRAPGPTLITPAEVRAAAQWLVIR